MSSLRNDVKDLLLQRRSERWPSNAGASSGLELSPDKLITSAYLQD